MPECKVQLPKGCLSTWSKEADPSSTSHNESKEADAKNKTADKAPDSPTSELPEGISVLFGRGFNALKKGRWQAAFQELMQEEEWKSTGLTDLINPRYDEFSFLPPSEGKISLEGLEKAIAILAGCGFSPLDDQPRRSRVLEYGSRKAASAETAETQPTR